jgi:hypothetical protein
MASSRMKYESKDSKGKDFPEAKKKSGLGKGTGHESAGGEKKMNPALHKMTGKGHSKHHKMK